MILDHIGEPVKRGADVAAVVIPVAAWVNFLPSVAAILSIIWLALRIVLALQEYRMNRRKDRAQAAVVKTYRQELNECLKEGVPPNLQKLLDQLK